MPCASWSAFFAAICGKYSTGVMQRCTAPAIATVTWRRICNPKQAGNEGAGQATDSQSLRIGQARSCAAILGLIVWSKDAQRKWRSKPKQDASFDLGRRVGFIVRRLVTTI
jgi:hypothetical protein